MAKLKIKKEDRFKLVLCRYEKTTDLLPARLDVSVSGISATIVNGVNYILPAFLVAQATQTYSLQHTEVKDNKVAPGMKSRYKTRQIHPSIEFQKLPEFVKGYEDCLEFLDRIQDKTTEEYKDYCLDEDDMFDEYNLATGAKIGVTVFNFDGLKKKPQSEMVAKSGGVQTQGQMINPVNEELKAENMKLKESNVSLQTDVADMKAQMAKLMEMVEAQAESKKESAKKGGAKAKKDEGEK